MLRMSELCMHEPNRMHNLNRSIDQSIDRIRSRYHPMASHLFWGANDPNMQLTHPNMISSEHYYA